MPLSSGENRDFAVAMVTVIVTLIRLSAGIQGSARKDGWWRVFCTEREAACPQAGPCPPVTLTGDAWELGLLGPPAGGNCLRVMTKHQLEGFQKGCLTDEAGGCRSHREH